jgi:hypothetical protein
VQAARTNPALRASANHGNPPIAATAKPGVFSGAEVVAAKGGGKVSEPVEPKAAPVQPKAAPLQPKAAPLQPKAAPAQPKAAPLQPKAAPVEHKAAPVEHKPEAEHP